MQVNLTDQKSPDDQLQWIAEFGASHNLIGFHIENGWSIQMNETVSSLVSIKNFSVLLPILEISRTSICQHLQTLGLETKVVMSNTRNPLI